MIRLSLISVVLAGVALPFTGCQGTGTSTEIQPTGLYRCIGESGYAPGELEKIMEDLKLEERECLNQSRPAMTKSAGNAAPSATDVPSDSIRVHTVVLDERCNLIQDSERTLPDLQPFIKSMQAWDLRDAEGESVATGIYFVNVSTERAGGARDTSYGKMGIFSDLCRLH